MTPTRASEDAPSFLRVGHFPTLIAALLYFDVSFMAWILLGPLAPFLREELGLRATALGLITAIPLLGGSLFRPLLGAIGERIGGRRTGLIGLVLTIITLVAGWLVATGPAHFVAVGLMLGIAGASFAVALPLASRWYPPEYQGIALGIAGAGNSGTLLVRDATGSYAAGLFGGAVVFVLGTLVLLELGTRWTQRWDRAIVQRTGLYSYRAALVDADDESVA